jgi:hypothetical protein
MEVRHNKQSKIGPPSKGGRGDPISQNFYIQQLD